MDLHINLAKLYLTLDDIEIHFKMPRLNMWSFILHISRFFCLFGIFCIFMWISILSGILYAILIFLVILLCQYAFYYGNTMKELTLDEKKRDRFNFFHYNINIYIKFLGIRSQHKMIKIKWLYSSSYIIPFISVTVYQSTKNPNGIYIYI